MSEPPDPVVLRLRAAGCVFAEDEAALLHEAVNDGAYPDHLERLVVRRVAGEPLETILGWVDFGGLRLVIDPSVFVPRRRTAVLATLGCDLARRLPHPVVVDLCCGAGAIAAVIADRVPTARLHAADLDPSAVANARRNLLPRGVEVFLGDLYDALPHTLRGRVDVLAVNAPYVPTDAIATMPPEARDHEPGLALDGGPDGLDVHRRVAAKVREWLAPGGHLLIETSRQQAPTAVRILATAGLDTVVHEDDEVGATVVVGRAT